MGKCPDCFLPKWSREAEAVSGPDTPWCECPFLQVEDYPEDEDD